MFIISLIFIIFYVFFEKMKDFLYKKSWFTLVEIVIAIIISSLVISWLTAMLIKMNQDIFDIQTKASIYSDFSKFQNDFNNLKLKYPKSLNIVDNSNGYDVLLLTNSWSERWIIVWVVDITKNSSNYLRLDPVSNFNFYWEKVLWIKELSSTQTNNIISNSWAVYSLQFYDTNLYKNLKVDSFVLNSYNSWSILDVSMDLITDFSPSLIWLDKDSSVEADNKFRINFSLAKDTNILLFSNSYKSFALLDKSKMDSHNEKDYLLNNLKLWKKQNEIF